MMFLLHDVMMMIRMLHYTFTNYCVMVLELTVVAVHHDFSSSDI